MEDYSIGSYTSFEGKEILVIDDRDGNYEEFRAIVSGCDYDIGISIEVITEEEKQHMDSFYGNGRAPYMYCLNGPSAPDYINTASYRFNSYNEEFQTTLNEIKNGIVYYSSTMNIYEKYYKPTSFIEMAECSFK